MYCGAQTLFILAWFYDDIVNISRIKPDIHKQKRFLNYEWTTSFFQNLVNFDLEMAEIWSRCLTNPRMY